ncbi:beta-ketoacyl-ACP synthase II [Longimicrobium sp.]|uniref:beta-ketoacyl-ACP synthase II n=1 Tax=Longimicrobium sp. TaxID=2029185 RepID=UPI002B71BA49|nr:beta-ketoacyl-ACP synthase II [Longimicrobium sp.]HSU12574.1 beta-ketoacyl-ACP synthase II [Longimicrobium sp.]
MNRRVVITGTGLISPVGLDVASSWAALLAGQSGAGPITQFDTTDFKVRFAAEVKGFEPEQYIDRKEAKRTDRFAQLAIGASVQAMRQAGLDDAAIGGIDPTRFGVIIGSGIGGIWTFEEQHRKLIERGPSRISPFFVPMFISDIAAGLVSIRWGLKGPNYCTVSACASSAHAVGNAFRSIKYDEADVMIAGGTEATVSPQTIAGFAAMTALSERNDSPETASRPFDATRDGFVLGEGSGMLVLEELEHAKARGATILAEIAGYGQTADAYHITAPAEGGEGAVRAIQLALKEAGATPDDVDYVNAHGTSTPANDKNETAAIRTALGERAYQIVVGSTKSMTGHTLGAAGGVEAVICGMVCREGKIPPTINFHERDPDCDLDYATGGMVERPVRLALSNSFGFGGHNVCLAVRRYDGA